MTKITSRPLVCYHAITRLPAFRVMIGITLLSIAILMLYAGVRANPQAPAFGILFLVNGTGDGDDASPGNNICETASGNNVCTLRAAIEEVNARNNGGDGITVNIPGSDPGCSGGVCTITLSSVLPDSASP